MCNVYAPASNFYFLFCNSNQNLVLGFVDVLCLFKIFIFNKMSLMAGYIKYFCSYIHTRNNNYLAFIFKQH